MMLARMGQALQLEPRPVGTKAPPDLTDLVAVRRALVKDRTPARNRAKGIGLAILRRQNADRLRRFDADLKTVDAAIADLIAADEASCAQHATLLGIQASPTLPPPL
jgi:transposase